MICSRVTERPLDRSDEAVVDKLTDEDTIAIAAYLASRKP